MAKDGLKLQPEAVLKAHLTSYRVRIEELLDKFKDADGNPLNETQRKLVLDSQLSAFLEGWRSGFKMGLVTRASQVRKGLAKVGKK